MIEYAAKLGSDCPFFILNKACYATGRGEILNQLPLDLSKEQIEEIIIKDERTLKQLDGKIPNKIIIVPGKVINLVG